MDRVDHLADERRRLQGFHVLRLLGMLWPCAVVLWVVPGRLFVSPDSTQYLSAARNLVAGNGLASYWWSGQPEPLTHFPPLYPFFLALVARVGLDMELAALWLNLVALAAIVWQSSRLAGLVTGGPAVQRARVMAFCALAVGLAHDVMYVSVMLFTEPLFIALTLGAIGTLATWLDRTSDGGGSADRGPIALSGALCALAVLTRFVGLALIAACVLAILLDERRLVRLRLRVAALFAAIAGAPLSLWLVYNRLRDLKVSNRDLAFHPVSLGDLKHAVLTVSHWLSPFMPWLLPRFTLFALGCLCLAGLGVAFWRVGLRDLFGEAQHSSARASEHPGHLRPSPRAAGLAIVFVLAYSGLLIVSISVADNSTPLDMRILSPLMPIAIVLVAALAALLARRQSDSPSWLPRIASASGVTLGGVYFVSQAVALVVWAPPARAEGLELNAIAHDAPAMIAMVQALPPEAVVYSNMPDLIYYFADRVAYGLPWRHSPTSLLPNPHYTSELSNLSTRTESTYVVMFEGGADRTYVANLEDVRLRQQFVTFDSIPGGVFARVAAPTPTKAPSRTQNQSSSHTSSQAWYH